MTYSNSRLQIKDPALGGGPATFVYWTNKPRAEMDVTDYFSDGADFGMKLADLVFIRRNGVEDADVHRVIAVTGRAVTTRFYRQVNGEMVAQSDVFRAALPQILPLPITQAAYDALAVKDPNTLYITT